MKNLKFISVLALCMLLMLGACKKDEPTNDSNSIAVEEIEKADECMFENKQKIVNYAEQRGFKKVAEDFNPITSEGYAEYASNDETLYIDYDIKDVVIGIQFVHNCNFKDAKNLYNTFYDSSSNTYGTRYSGDISFKGEVKKYKSHADCMSDFNQIKEEEIKDSDVIMLSEQGYNVVETKLRSVFFTHYGSYSTSGLFEVSYRITKAEVIF